MANRKSLIIANWKMNPGAMEEARRIFGATRDTAKKLKDINIIVCPPFPYLYPISRLDHPKNVFLGVQNVASEIKGPFTGEVSAEMAKNIGALFSIIGHSERRAMGETNEIVRKKLQIASDAGLTPILCIGEKERDKEGTHLALIKEQIKECLSSLQKKHLVGITIAYEPIWAIGRSYKEAMDATDVHETVLFIKKVISELFGRDIAAGCRIIYGGSVEPENAEAIMKNGNIDGFLVGHASLISEQFSAILKAANLRK